MATILQATDVVIVGAGAVGGVAALPLARAGLQVIGLEAGTWLTSRDFAPDELRNNVRGWPQAAQKANREVPTHRRNETGPYSPRPSVHPMMNAVGGTSLHYWGQSWRLNPWDFRVVSETTRRYGRGRIPANSTVEDWPFGLEELEPYYDTVEYEVGISGNAGNVNGSTRAATSSKDHAAGRIRCRRSGAPGSPNTWARPREGSGGTPFQVRRRSIRDPMKGVRAVSITGSALEAAVT